MEALDPRAVQRRLEIEKSQYYREHARALAALAAVLTEGTPVAAGGSARPARPGRGSAAPPPLRSAAPTSRRPSSVALPRPLTSFVGREREVADVREALSREGVRLLTLTGPGGVGKTRLAMEAAAALLAAGGGPDSAPGGGPYPDGVRWVDLGSLADGALVPRAALAAVGGREGPGRPPLAALAEALTPRRLLLVLDNCEHLADACAALADALLEACPGVRLLATSREPLGVAGEAAWRVPSLAVPELPDRRRPEPAERLAGYEAVRLFTTRAGAARPGFAVTPHNAAAVAEVCRRLDGLPLALELAAARVRVLNPAQLAARLGDRFRLLTGGGRTAPPRQQTLRATLDWSHDLLSEADRALLRRLAVFAGGFALPAAEAVGGGAPLAAGDVLDGLTRLLDRSLVQLEADAGGRRGGRRGAEARYRLLETVREYALEQLEASGEAAALRARHAEHYLALEEGQPDRIGRPRASTGPEPASRARLVRELDDVRAALRWCLEHGAAERALAFAVGPLWRAWFLGGHLVEARRWLDELLAAGEDLPASLRAAGHFGAGTCAQFMGDHGEARARLETSVALSRQAGEAPTQALTALGRARWLDGDDRGAEAAIREGLAGAEAAGDGVRVASDLRDLSLVARTQGDYPQARALLERSVVVARAYFPRYPMQYVRSVARLGQLAALEGRLPEAAARLREALAGMAQEGVGNSIPDALEWLAPVLSALGRPRAAARLLGAAAAAAA